LHYYLSYVSIVVLNQLRFMTIIYIFIAAFAVMLVSLVGIITVSKVFGSWAERNLKYLTTFATGVFVIVAYNLVKEATHSDLSIAALLGLIAVGAIAAFSVDKVIPNAHHHHDSLENPSAHGSHSKAGAQRIILSDFLHNITDGFLIVPAFLVDIRLGLFTTAGIMIHEVAQEISEFFVLKSAGYSTKKALTINFATSASILIGVVMSLLISNIFEDIIFVLLAIAAGIIIYTIFKDLIPYSIAIARREKTYAKHISAALAGALLILALTSLTADTHVHSEHAHTEDEHNLDNNRERHDSVEEASHAEESEMHTE
jgi:zinc and cadmium transporter